MLSRSMKRAALTMAALISTGGAVLAGYGKAEDGEIGLQGAASPIAQEIHDFHTELVWIITAISLFVLVLLAIVIVRFNARKNPVPSKTTHNAAIEVAWTLIPVLILVVIAVPSFRLLKNQLVIPPADMTIKATGNQWFWQYDYAKDSGNISFSSYMLQDSDIKDPATQPRLLAVDNEVVVPVNKVVRMQVTATDVLHSFVIPSLGVRMDAVPGRLNETWFKATREGMYYGQCSELCGKDHAFMPIAFRVVSEQAYAQWLADAQKKFTASVGTDSRLALAPALPNAR